jgi:glycosyltransferase involved in cell wall biosynthesis
VDPSATRPHWNPDLLGSAAPPGGWTRDPIPILFIGTTWTVGGAERVCADIVRGFTQAPFRAEVLALRAPGGVAEQLASEGIPLTANLTGSQRLDPRLITRIRAVIQRGRFQAIYFLDHAHAVFHGTLASLGTPVRARVMPVHTTGQWNGQPSLKRPIRLVRSRLDRIIAIAEAQRDYLIREEGVPREQLVVIPNGVPLAQPDAATRATRRREARAKIGVAPETPVIGITAVLRPEKHHELLLRAFARVRAAVPGAELWIVGDGPRRAALEAEAVKLGHGVVSAPANAPAATSGGTSPSVRFLGYRSDVRSIIPGFDLAVLCSHPRVETLPLSLIEAMDEALPLVGTRVGALHEMIEDGRSGLLVAPSDEEGLAAAMLRLLRSPDERRAMGLRGQTIARERYAVEGMVAATRDLILTLLVRKQPARG